AASVERQSEHPHAFAIVGAARSRGLELTELQGFSAVAGRGACATVGSQEVVVGSSSYLAELGITSDASFAGGAPGAATIVQVAAGGKHVGSLFFEDMVRPSAKQAVGELNRQGIRVVLATGDGESAARAVAEAVGVKEVHFGMTPATKAELVKRLQDQGAQVAMAGDGINDAPALAQAEVGIAMASGTDIAMHTSDIVLLNGDLSGILRARKVSKAMMTNIAQNLFLAFAYNIVAVPVAAGILAPLTGIVLDPMVAAVAMSLSSVAVIANALRLRGVQL
ncbi:MAG: HAD-IC family P-type ATPase, partial [Acidobacteriales bacterium]|nr:HAD-IC family P-type ATPase [Terriglobales bacterium]